MAGHPIDRRLREIGRDRRWLASQSNLSQSTISNICTRKTPITPGTATQKKLCRALSIDLGYLLGVRGTTVAQGGNYRPK